jgi:hypothetical protein
MTKRLIAVVCIGLVLFAAFTPVAAAHTIAVVFDPVWDPFVPSLPTFIRSTVVRLDEQSHALGSPLLLSRPPPLA